MGVLSGQWEACQFVDNTFCEPLNFSAPITKIYAPTTYL